MPLRRGAALTSQMTLVPRRGCEPDVVRDGRRIGDAAIRLKGAREDARSLPRTADRLRQSPKDFSTEAGRVSQGRVRPRFNRSPPAEHRSRPLRSLTSLALHCLVQIPVGLQTHPELRGRLQQPCEPERRVRGNAALSRHDFVQAVQRDAETASRVQLTETERLQVFLEQNLSRRNRRAEPVGLPSRMLKNGS